MPNTRETERRLLLVGKAKTKEFEQWQHGCDLSIKYGCTIVELRRKMVSERFKLALVHCSEGKRLQALARPPYRAIVSRFYYVMYHAMRAVCLEFYQGDDYEKHSDLPTKVPSDFPSCDVWKNDLKNARLTRNAADYDPYPKSRAVWENDASDLDVKAQQLLSATRGYLRGKGYTNL